MTNKTQPIRDSDKHLLKLIKSTMRRMRGNWGIGGDIESAFSVAILDALRPYLRTQPTPQVSFDEWCASVTDCGHTVQPNSATARQRKLGWDAAIAALQPSTKD